MTTKLEEAKDAVTEVAGRHLCDRGMGEMGICTAWQSKECRCEKVVLAVLRAIREPSDEMLSAMNAVGIDMDPRDYWPAGIDALLAEDGK